MTEQPQSPEQPDLAAPTGSPGPNDPGPSEAPTVVRKSVAPEQETDASGGGTAPVLEPATAIQPAARPIPPPTPPPIPDLQPSPSPRDRAVALANDAVALANERPEIPVGAAFAGGFVLATILKRIAR